MYASNFAVDRRLLWQDLCATQAHYAQGNLPWIVLGDFIVTLLAQEHSRYLDYSMDQNPIREFQNAVHTCGLTDLTYEGPHLTWSNSQDMNPIGKKLDKTLVNGRWLSTFPHAFAKFKSGGISDHAIVSVRLRPILHTLEGLFNSSTS